MPFEAPIDEKYDPEKDFNGPAAGRYHVSVVEVDEDGGERGEMIVQYEVLAGSTEGQEGCIHRDYFSKTMKAMGRIHQLAMACKMVTPEQLKELKAKGQSPTYDFRRDAVGKQICVELTDEEYQGKTRVKCGFAIYAVDDKKVAAWPKNAGMLQSGGYHVEAPKEGEKAADVAAQTPNGKSALSADEKQELLGGVL